MKERFFLGRDCSSHWYLVPVAKKAEWDDWANLDEDDERAWNAPEWAQPIDGVYGLTFVDPIYSK